ncbi:MAG TPA: glycosyltransferase [Chthoniobacterales bacterium]
MSTLNVSPSPAPVVTAELSFSGSTEGTTDRETEPRLTGLQRNPEGIPVAISAGPGSPGPDRINPAQLEDQSNDCQNDVINLKAGGIIVPLKANGGSVTALVLTYNRKEVLGRCLNAVLTQDERVDEVIVLDNGSTDGTCEYLQETGILEDARVILYRLTTNVGPAGGVDVLFRLFRERGNDWLWFLDDDTIASADTLKELKGAYAANFSAPEEVGFLKSMVVSADGSPNGLPEADLRAAAGYSPSWAHRLRSGLLKVRWSTFNSILIPRSTLTRIGDIRPQFFFAGEDIDFTFRVTDALPGYLVGRSQVTHLCAESGRFSSLLEKHPKRISMGAFYYRNNLYFRYNYYSFGRTVLYAGKCLYEAALSLTAKTYRFRRATAILGGLLSGVAFVARHRKEGQWTPSLDRRSRAIQLSGSLPSFGVVPPPGAAEVSPGVRSEKPASFARGRKSRTGAGGRRPATEPPTLPSGSNFRRRA